MPIDHEHLAQLRRYEDTEAGISEEFAGRRIGPGRAFGLISAPLAGPASLGCVICPSLGPEHGNLRRLETLLARSLAAAGFPTLRVRPDLHPARGAYGEIDLSARLAEAGEAVELLREASRVDEVALGGALFGATVAALTVDSVRAAGVFLIEPVVKGKQYVRETIRRQAVAELVATGEARSDGTASAPGPLEELATTGATSLRGLRLSQEEFARISGIDLAVQPLAFQGASLLVGASPTGAVTRSFTALEERLRSLGGDVTVEILRDALPAPFGEYFYRNEGGVRVDTRLDLDQRIATSTAAWAVEAFGAALRRAAA